MRTSFTVGFVSPSRRSSTIRSLVDASSDASAVTDSWKTGACQASVRRRAIVFRIDVSSTTSISSAGAAAGSRGRRSAVVRALDVLRDDPALRPRPGERCEIEPPLARHPPGERARLDRLALGWDRSLPLRMLLARSVVGRGLAL